MIEARETKTPKSAPRATAKRGRAEGSGAKYTVTEQEGFVWVKCDECSKRRYAPVGKVDASTPDAKWKVRTPANPHDSDLSIGGIEMRILAFGGPTMDCFVFQSVFAPRTVSTRHC